ncbi:hypothetical protein Fmac_015184 [Flemingia macrophylla]|uniref:non-specific serine/threonine protein kinase n=1 Tax=Flemingia macrophylla TaxID=520843 RepID=A0ABD1MDV0_9FABA
MSLSCTNELIFKPSPGPKLGLWLGIVSCFCSKLMSAGDLWDCLKSRRRSIKVGSFRARCCLCVGLYSLEFCWPSLLSKPTKLFSTGTVTHLPVSGYIFGAFRDPSGAISRWPYGGFSLADHLITWSISSSYTTVDLPSGSAAGDGNPTVVTRFIPFFLSPKIVIIVLFFPRIVKGVRYLKDFNITEAADGVGKGITEEFDVDVDDGTLEIHLYWAGKGTTTIPDRGVYGPLISVIEMIPNSEIPSKGLPYGAIVGIVATSCGLVILILVALWKMGFLCRKDTTDKEIYDFGLAKVDEEENTRIRTRDCNLLLTFQPWQFISKILTPDYKPMLELVLLHVQTFIKNYTGWIRLKGMAKQYRCDIKSLQQIVLQE